jgi:Family of unknown function (DUF5317)
MLLTLAALLAGVVAGLASGGRVARLRSRQVRSWWLLVAGVGAEALAGHGPAAPALAVAGAAALVAFAFRNAIFAGMGIVVAGVLANAAVVVVDGGMPVNPAAVVRAGITTRARLPGLDYGARHHPQSPSDRLVVLDDRIPLRIDHKVVSAGDLAVAAGLAVVIASSLRPLGRHGPGHRHAVAARRRRLLRRASRRRQLGAEPALEVPVERVEHRPGGGLLGAASGGEPPPRLAGGGVAEDDERAGAEVG